MSFFISQLLRETVCFLSSGMLSCCSSSPLTQPFYLTTGTKLMFTVELFDNNLTEKYRELQVRRKKDIFVEN